MDALLGRVAAADAGFDAVGLRLIRVTDTSLGYPLMHDPAIMRSTKAALTDTGLRVNDIEFAKIEPDTDIPALGAFRAAWTSRPELCAAADGVAYCLLLLGLRQQATTPLALTYWQNVHPPLSDAAAASI